jgi:hypothetical protein
MSEVKLDTRSPKVRYISKFIGQIILIDLDNGMQVTTRLKNVVDDQLICDDIILFQIATVLPDPSMPPGPGNVPQQTLQTQPLGGPFRDPKSGSPPIDLERVMFVHKPIDAIDRAYSKATSGIEVVGAGALHGMRR